MTDSTSSSDMNKHLRCLQHFWSSSITSRSREGAAPHTHPWRKPQGAFPSRRALKAAINPHQNQTRQTEISWSSGLQFPITCTAHIALQLILPCWGCVHPAFAVGHQLQPITMAKPQEMFSMASPRNFPNHCS